ncbi:MULTISPECIES: type II toxin-antitoxin system RelE/ParE family toxin [Methanocalculus]|uniref:type II toxin-antitoxin system RelE family toxin n=1 Tax=Methanocalculus TaxID=71151 RepID=UPI0020A17E05|nr:type II toxin-antitoxin system RelE/ParE family toxin [Methanocalculus sp. MSAO_Arc1]MCP1661438.1 mRNA interferase RelE/StbE [Methanocalculus sp. AMF5]
MYTVLFTPTAEKAYGALPRVMRIRLAIALEKYAADPYARHDVRKLRGYPPEKPRYRLRVGDYRILFQIIADKLIICVVAVGKKKNLRY